MFLELTSADGMVWLANSRHIVSIEPAPPDALPCRSVLFMGVERQAESYIVKETVPEIYNQLRGLR